MFFVRPEKYGKAPKIVPFFKDINIDILGKGLESDEKKAIDTSADSTSSAMMEASVFVCQIC